MRLTGPTDEELRVQEKNSLDSVDKPSSARIYDYLLGGEHNYAIDREFANKQMELAPDMPKGMRSNREFIGRTVRLALQRGVRQFVDIGAGLPSQGQAHEIADAIDPEAQASVVYIDNEQIAHAHSEILLDDEADPARHRAVFADFFDTVDLWERILDSGVIDPHEPVCLLITAILHFMPDSTEPEKALAFYRDQVCSDSMLVLTHISDGLEHTNTAEIVKNYSRTTNPAYLRTPDEFRAYFDGWELLDPGVVWAVEWRPDGEPEWWEGNPARVRYLAGVGVKP